MRHCCATSCEPQAGEAAPPAILALPFLFFLMTLLTLDMWALKGVPFLFLGPVSSGSLAFAMMFSRCICANHPEWWCTPLFTFLDQNFVSSSVASAMSVQAFFKTWATNLPHNRTRQAYLDALPCSGGCMASFLH